MHIRVLHFKGFLKKCTYFEDVICTDVVINNLFEGLLCMCCVNVLMRPRRQKQYCLQLEWFLHIHLLKRNSSVYVVWFQKHHSIDSSQRNTSVRLMWVCFSLLLFFVLLCCVFLSCFVFCFPSFFERKFTPTPTSTEKQSSNYFSNTYKLVG